MAESSRSELFVCPLGGGIGNLGAINYAFRAKKGNYDDIMNDLGIAKADDNDTGLVFGCNSPKPIKLRIAYQIDGNRTGSCVRFCQPDSVSNCTTGGSLNGKQVTVRGTKYQINKVTVKNS